MKKLFALLMALLLAALLCVPALATEAADAAQETAQTVGETADQAEETVEAASEDAAEAVEEQAAEEKPAVSPIFKNLLELKWYTWAVIGVLLAGGVILALSAKKTKWDSYRLAVGAMCIAIAFVLSCIRLYRMPQGGSITPASMLPLVIFMLACGPLQGFVIGCAFGFLKLITDPWIIHPVQMLVDYPLAYGAMILGCLAALIPVKKPFKLPLAVLLAAVGRYAMAVLSGTVFFAEYAGDQNALLYSLGYNITYLGPDTVVCMIVALIPGMSQLVDMLTERHHH